MPHHSFHHHEPSHNPHNHPDVLDVILVCSNTRRYESRYRLFKKIYNEIKSVPNVRVTVVEMAFGERPHMLGSTNDILLRNPDELWHKEQMINIGISRLPHDWKYVCWMDADISFVNNSWGKEIIEALQHYQIIQPWSHAIDLGPNEETFATYTSFCSLYLSNPCSDAFTPKHKKYYEFPHSGYCWAARRQAIDGLGGLIDTAILGAGDHHMAWSLIGLGKMTFPHGVTHGYKKPILAWEEKALKYIKKNIGFMPGTILHYFHGPKKARQYQSRWKILVENKFNPHTDLTRDWNGLWRLRTDTPRQWALRDAIRRYMSTRDEDDIRIE